MLQQNVTAPLAGFQSGALSWSGSELSVTRSSCWFERPTSTSDVLTTIYRNETGFGTFPRCQPSFTLCVSCARRISCACHISNDQQTTWLVVVENTSQYDEPDLRQLQLLPVPIYVRCRDTGMPIRNKDPHPQVLVPKNQVKFQSIAISLTFKKQVSFAKRPVSWDSSNNIRLSPSQSRSRFYHDPVILRRLACQTNQAAFRSSKSLNEPT